MIDGKEQDGPSSGSRPSENEMEFGENEFTSQRRRSSSVRSAEVRGRKMSVEDSK